MRYIHTEVEIQASAARVWEVLTDLASYPEWNPLIRQASGPLCVGQRLKLSIHPPGLLSRTVPVKILQMEPNRTFRWLGKLCMRGLMDGDHSFTIEPLGADRVRVVQSEEFRGLLVPVFARWLVPNMRRGFEQLNEALKKRAELEVPTP
jgi:hypothetical protein